MILGSGLIQAADTWPKASDWLIRDEFTDTVAAGSVDGTAATPGPGTRAATDTENKLSVGSGVLAWSDGKATPGEIDPVAYYGAVTRLAGLALILKETGFSDRLNVAGFSAAAPPVSPSSYQSETRMIGTTLYVADAHTTTAIAGAVVPATAYTIAVVLRTAGALHFIKGGAFTKWTLLWVTTASNTASLYPVIGNYDGTLGVDYLRVIALPAPFDTDDGLATDTHSGSVAAGTTFTHESDFVLEFTVDTLPSSGSMIVFFRFQDATNTWRLLFSSDGNFILQEVASGPSASRASAVGVVSNGHRIVVIAEGTTIRGYSNNTLRWTYASATNFATATAGEVDALGTGGAVSDLKTWPRTLSGTAASILNKVSA